MSRTQQQRKCYEEVESTKTPPPRTTLHRGNVHKTNKLITAGLNQPDPSADTNILSPLQPISSLPCQKTFLCPTPHLRSAHFLSFYPVTLLNDVQWSLSAQSSNLHYDCIATGEWVRDRRVTTVNICSCKSQCQIVEFMSLLRAKVRLSRYSLFIISRLRLLSLTLPLPTPTSFSVAASFSASVFVLLPPLCHASASVTRSI